MCYFSFDFDVFVTILTITMGSLLTRASSTNASELQTANLYTYPPKSGNMGECQ